MNGRKIIRLAAILGMIAVIFGAFGAHTLREMIDEKALGNWETGVRYQFYHALALLFIGVISLTDDSKKLRNAALMMTLGIVCFSGSLYLLSLRSLINMPLQILGPITPLGGLFLIVGWIMLFFSQSEEKNTTNGK
jgi:uncharacterized membrane protein YgdD (TMEM256/DUF423 family)